MKHIFSLSFVLFTVFFYQLSAQDIDDLDALLDSELAKEPASDRVEYATSAFKTSRIINLHSNEKVAPGALEFRIEHRFGSVNNGFETLYGLDGANVRVALELGVLPWLMVGVGRTSSTEGTIDYFAKGDLVRQSNKFPFSASLFASAYTKTAQDKFENVSEFAHRNSYVAELILARKFSSDFSFALVPVFVHENVVPRASDANTTYALGIGGRYKLTKRVTLNLEYIYRIPAGQEDSQRYKDNFDPFTIGFDIETGGHVFQLHFTNSQQLIETRFINGTTNSWFGDTLAFSFGFNISREFTLW